MKMLYVLSAAMLLLSYLGCQSTGPSFSGGPCPDAESVSLAEPPRTVDEVEVAAEPIGGMMAVQRRIQYPESAKREGVQGEVRVRFVVDERGCVVQADVVQGVDARLDAEALRVIRASRFEPAREAGEAVAVELTMPINFQVMVRQ